MHRVYDAYSNYLPSTLWLRINFGAIFLFYNMNTKEMYPWRTFASFLVVLFSMPLGHALMILMEHYLQGSLLHYCGFLLGFIGLVMVIVGVFVKGDTRQTIWGLLGGLLFWTGWVEFLFLYYAQRL